MAPAAYRAGPGGGARRGGTVCACGHPVAAGSRAEHAPAGKWTRGNGEQGERRWRDDADLGLAILDTGTATGVAGPAFGSSRVSGRGVAAGNERGSAAEVYIACVAAKAGDAAQGDRIAPHASLAI